MGQQRAQLIALMSCFTRILVGTFGPLIGGTTIVRSVGNLSAQESQVRPVQPVGQPVGSFDDGTQSFAGGIQITHTQSKTHT